MMDEPKDGGQAFPTPIAGIGDGGLEYSQVGGMSLRDWFAGKAISAAWAQADRVEGAARLAYRVADAMLAERKRVR